MSTSVDRRAYAELATSAVSAGEAFAYWREMICATFVRLAAEPTAAGRFSGRIEHVPVGDLELSAVVAGGQHVRRTRSLIAQGNEEYLLASIQRSGTGRIEQDRRTALLSPGDIAFYDSTRPYTLHFDNPFHQLVVQVPKRELMLRDTRPLTARALRRGTPGGAVSAFFTSLFDATRASGEQPSVLLPHAIGLLCSAAFFAAAAARERVLEFLRRNLADPSLDADAVAAACHVSRRRHDARRLPEGLARGVSKRGTAGQAGSGSRCLGCGPIARDRAGDQRCSKPCAWPPCRPNPSGWIWPQAWTR
jgi:hypothetical protein